MCVDKLHSFEISIVRVDVNKILHNSVAVVILFLRKQMKICYHNANNDLIVKNDLFYYFIILFSIL